MAGVDALKKEAEAEDAIASEARAAAKDAVEAATREVGATTTLLAVKEQQRQVRRERKQREALEAVADPAKTALKRVAKNLGKRKAKKRKLESSKRLRDSGGGIGLGGKKARAAF